MVVPPRDENSGSSFTFEKETVEKLAKELGWFLVGDFPESAVLCFCRENDRMSVYYRTGTVASCFNHPTMGKTQIYYPHNSLESLEQHFQADQSMKNYKMFTRRGTGEFGQPEPVLNHRECLASANAKIKVKRDGTDGMDTTDMVALGTTWFRSDCYGSYMWGDGIPLKLDRKLRGRQRWLPHIDIIDFGPSPSSFFVQFADGSTCYNDIPKLLELALYENDEYEVQTLALGQKGSFFCLWADGHAEWAGLSPEMETALLADFQDVQEVSLGPKGEMFIRYSNGCWTSQGHSRECDRAITKIQKMSGKAVVHIAFGANDSFLITYE
jgi:hypothetical protein